MNRTMKKAENTDDNEYNKISNIKLGFSADSVMKQGHIAG